MLDRQESSLTQPGVHGCGGSGRGERESSSRRPARRSRPWGRAPAHRPRSRRRRPPRRSARPRCHGPIASISGSPALLARRRRRGRPGADWPTRAAGGRRTLRNPGRGPGRGAQRRPGIQRRWVGQFVGVTGSARGAGRHVPGCRCLRPQWHRTLAARRGFAGPAGLALPGRPVGVDCHRVLAGGIASGGLWTPRSGVRRRGPAWWLQPAAGPPWAPPGLSGRCPNPLSLGSPCGWLGPGRCPNPLPSGSPCGWLGPGRCPNPLPLGSSYGWLGPGRRSSHRWSPRSAPAGNGARSRPRRPWSGSSRPGALSRHRRPGIHRPRRYLFRNHWS